MPSHIHNLDRESILLMYLADELSAEDRTEVEQMLQTDRVLRQQHEELAATLDLAGNALAGLDRKEPLSAPLGSSLRRVSRAMAQWHVDRLAAARPQVTEPLPARRFGWVMTLGAVAACIVIGSFIMWSRVDDSKNSTNVARVMAPDPHATDTSLTEDQEQQEIADATASFTPAVTTDTDQQLTSAEREMKTLALFSDSITTSDDGDSSTP